MFAKFMNKKDFHPGSKANIKRVWMAEQKILAESQKEKDLELQYNKEQAKFKNRQAISNDDRIKSGLDFLYDAPPGFNKESKATKKERKTVETRRRQIQTLQRLEFRLLMQPLKPEEEEGEVRFEWQRGAPREAYTKSLGIEARDQPFGIPVRNVKCIRCGKWGHINTDRECPLFNKSRNADVDPSLITDIADPMRLLKDMRTEGLTLKQNVLGRVFNPDDPNQQIVASDEEEEDDAEAAFLASLTDKQKKKLLRKLNRLEQDEMDAQESSTKHKKKKRKKSHQSDSDEEPKKHAKKKHHKQSDSSDSEELRNKKRSKKKEKSSNLKDSPERETKEKHRHSEDSERFEHHGATYRHSKDSETVRHRSNTETSRYYRSDDRYEEETHRHKDRREHHRYNGSEARHKHTGDKRR